MKTRTTSPQSASVLLVTIFFGGLLTLMLGGFLYITAYENSAVDRSQTWNRAMVIAEAGIEEGLSMINRYAFTVTPIQNWPDRAVFNGWSDVGGVGTVYMMQRTIGDGFYKVYITNLNSTPTIKSTGYVYSDKTKSYVGRSVLVNNAAGSYFLGMVLAKRMISINGGAIFDSYNSQDTNYSTGGQWDITKRRAGGNVGSILSNVVAAITDSGSAKIYGTIATGPGSTISMGGQATVGDAAWVDGGNGGIKPGYSRNDLNVYIPDAPPLPTGTYFAVPTPSSSGSQVVLNAGGGQKLYYASSTYNLNNSQSILITNGTVVIDFRAGIKINSQAYVQIAQGSKMIMYLGTENSQLDGQGLVNRTGFATNCIVYGKNNCLQMEYNGGSAFVGYIYVPYADVTLNGGSDTSGGLVANSLQINGNMMYHYDESLGWPQGGTSIYRVVSWKEVAP